MWPKLQEKFNERLSQRPARQDVATGNHYGDKVYIALKEKKEVRNITCNLAWTHPLENTMLQEHITLEAVQTFAIDFFTNTAPDTQDDAQVAASAAQGEGAGGLQVKKTLHASNKRWMIPERVPKGYEIPIAIISANEPEKGKFRRMGFDVAGNTTWLAMVWALEEKNSDAERDLGQLMLDWPFDFYLFEGTEDEMEEKITKHIINLPAATERLRDFCGLDMSNLMRITGADQDLL